VPARPREDLAAVRGRLLHHLGDLVVRVAEQLVQHVDRALDRRQPLEQRQERERQRLVALHARVGARHGHERLRQPRPDVRLAPHARRAQVIDRQPRHHRGEERLRRLDVLGAVEAQERLLHQVLRLAHAAGHPVREREQQRAQLVGCHVGGRHLV
jgi:hypothetical protein